MKIHKGPPVPHAGQPRMHTGTLRRQEKVRESGSLGGVEGKKEARAAGEPDRVESKAEANEKPEEQKILKPQIEEAKPKEPGTLSEPHLHSLLTTLLSHLEFLAKNDGAAPREGALAHVTAAQSEAQLRDILRQVLTGDYGFTLTHDPRASLGRLFAKLQAWPKGVPPGRPYDLKSPWQDHEWDDLVHWINTAPDLPPDDELLFE